MLNLFLCVNADGNPTGARDIGKHESKHLKRNIGTTMIEEVTNVDSDKDEDLHMVQYKLEGKASQACGAVNGHNHHMEQPQSGRNFERT